MINLMVIFYHHTNNGFFKICLLIIIFVSDIAVGAPFEDGGGSVYIYIGGKHGLSEKPSQIIKSPPHSISMPLFGFGLSNSFDIDKNEFNDLAIGAPNIDKVFLYRSYPVVKIIVEINAQNIKLTATDTKFSVHVKYSTDSVKDFDFELSTLIVLDKRATLKNSNLKLQKNIKPKKKFDSTIYDISLKGLMDGNVPNMNPIAIEFHYKLVKNFEEFKDSFCEDCVALNPFDSKVITKNIEYIYGCTNSPCETNLKLLHVEK